MDCSSLSAKSVTNELEKRGHRRKLHFVPVFCDEFQKLSISSNGKSAHKHRAMNNNSSIVLQSSKKILCSELPESSAVEANNPCKTKQKLSYSESLEDVTESSKENESAYSNASLSTSRIVKRKVLRHKNGEAVISEEESMFTPSSDSIYTSDSSTNHAASLTGSWLSLCSSSYDTENESGQQILATSSSQKGKLRKCDPVSRYHEYRKYWEAFKPPGEKGHQNLRWAIREKMLEHDTR